MVPPSAANRNARQEQNSMKNMRIFRQNHVKFGRFRVFSCGFDTHPEAMPGMSIY